MSRHSSQMPSDLEIAVMLFFGSILAMLALSTIVGLGFFLIYVVKAIAHVTGVA